MNEMQRHEVVSQYDDGRIRKVGEIVEIEDERVAERLAEIGCIRPAGHFDAVVAACMDLDPESDFGPDGKPSAAALSRIAGAEVTGPMRDRAWEEIERRREEPPPSDETMSSLVEACGKLEPDSAEHFTKDGLPRTEALAELAAGTGIMRFFRRPDVTAAMRDEAWSQHQARTQQDPGNESPAGPAAQE